MPTPTLTTSNGTAPAAGRGWTRLRNMITIETRLLFRRRTTLLSVLAGPAILLAYALLLDPQTPVAWAALSGLAGVVGLLITTYSPATSVLTLRRESLVLSRLRTTELSGGQIVAAAFTPLLAVGVLQGLVMFAVYAALGAPVPQRPDLILLGMLLAGVLVVAAAAVTSTISTSAEGVQFAVMPLLLAAAVGANIVAGNFPDEVRAAMLLIPVTPLADLVARAWIGTAPEMVQLPLGLPPVLVDLLLLAAWTVVFTLVARDRWRWTPRG